MRYGVAIPQANRFATPGALRSLARAAEDLGFDSLWVSDHVLVPEGHGYIPERMLEPLAVLPFVAAATSHITVGTSVLIAPYRHPVFVAKYLSSVDVLAEGRLVVGVGVGWLEEEFDALGVPFAERGSRTDEALRVYRDLWTTETSSFEGEHVRYERMRMFPKVAEGRRGGIPVWVGGNTTAARRRAAELGDGWHPINLSPADLAVAVADYRRRCAGAGRPVGPVCLRHMPGGRTSSPGPQPLSGDADAQAADVRAWAGAGLDELMLSLNAPTVEALVGRWRAFMRDVVPRVG